MGKMADFLTVDPIFRYISENIGNPPLIRLGAAGKCDRFYYTQGRLQLGQF
jgi:hypothetical protein